MKKLLLLLLFGVIVGISTLVAQRSYYRIGNTQVDRVVILDEGGYLRFERIKVQHADSAMFLFPDRIDEYRNYEEEIFRAYEMADGKRVFLQVLEEGSLALLFMIDRNQQQRFFLELAPGALLELNNVKGDELYYKSVLEASWRQCDGLRGLIRDAAFQKASLRYVIRAHNTCKYVPPPRARLIISADMTMQRLAVNEGDAAMSYAPIAAYRSIGYDWEMSWGARVAWEQPLASSYWHLVAGLQVQQFSTRETVPFSVRTLGDRLFRVEISLIDISVPMGIRYIHAAPKLRPHVYAGIAPSYWAVGKLDGLEIFYRSAGSGPQETPYEERLSPWGMSIQLKAGLDYQLAQERITRVEIGMERRSGLTNDRIFALSTFTVGVGVGL